MAVDKNFVVKHGLEVNTNLIYGDAVRARVGIGTTLAGHKLHVAGDLKADNEIVTGISSLNNVSISGYVSAGGTIGQNKQFLISTGAGIAWTTAPNLRVVQTFVAEEGQVQFNFAHTLGLIDVYVNGVKLSTYDYLETDVYVALTTPCVVGDIVELIGYYTYQNIGAANTGGISGLTLLDEGTIIGAPSAVTSLNFVGGQVVASGTGAGVTVYVGDGAGIGIGSSGVLIGTGITTLNFVGAGNTFKINGSTIDISINSGSANYWAQNASGIHTTSRVGIGSTLPNAGVGLDVRNIIKTDSFFASPKKIDRNVDTLAEYNNFAAGPVSVESGSTITVVPTSTLTLFGGDANTYLSVGDWIRTSVGIHTLINVGAGTTNPRFALEVGAVGSATTSLWVNGNARVTGILTVGTSSIILNGNDDSIIAGIVSATKVTGIHDLGLLEGDHGTLTDATTDAFGVNVETKLDLLQDPGGSLNVLDLGNIGDVAYDSVEWAKTNVGIHTLSSVGIGTTNPPAKLNVVDNSFSDALRITQLGGGNALVVEDDTNPDATPFVIDAIGNVGIGTSITSILYKLRVHGSGTTIFQITNDTEGAADSKGLAFGYDTTFNRQSIVSATVPLILQTSLNNTHIILQGTNTTRRVGVGSTSPNTKFDVNGSAYVSGNLGIGTTNPTSTLTVSGSATFTDTRLASVSEKSTIVSGNTVSLVYNTGGGNVAICTNPTGPITLNVTGIPTDSSFNNRTISFTVVAIQTATGYACTTVNLNGVSRSVRFPGGVVSVASTSSYDIFNFTGINTVGSGSTTANYQVLGLLNGNFK